MAGRDKLANRRVADLCVALEATMGDVYRALARLHAGDAEIAALFEKTAKEEDAHASHFRLAPGFFDSAVIETTVDAAQLRVLLASVHDLLASLATSQPTIVESLTAAVALEEQFSEFHMATAFRFSDPAHRRMFEAMMNADRDHIGSLRRALERRR